MLDSLGLSKWTSILIDTAITCQSLIKWILDCVFCLGDEGRETGMFPEFKVYNQWERKGDTKNNDTNIMNI